MVTHTKNLALGLPILFVVNLAAIDTSYLKQPTQLIRWKYDQTFSVPTLSGLFFNDLKNGGITSTFFDKFFSRDENDHDDTNRCEQLYDFKSGLMLFSQYLICFDYYFLPFEHF